MMERFISIISGIFLLVLAGFAWGWLALTFKIFPYAIINSSINDISAFVEGGDGEQKLGIVEKLKNDAGGTPFRLLVRPIHTLSFNGCNRLASQFSMNKDSCELFIPRKGIKSYFSSGALVFGPFVDLRAGKYEAVFNLSINAPLLKTVGYFDVVSIINGESTVFQRGSISGTAGQKKDIRLNFSLPQDMRRLEIRIIIEKPVPSVVSSLTISRKPYWLSENFSTINFDHKNPRRANPQVIKKRDTLFDGGVLFIFGAIDSKESLHGGFFLNEQGEIVHTININDDKIVEKINEYNSNNDEYKYHPMETRFPHGVEVLRDGSIIFNDGDIGYSIHQANSIRRIDWCGNEIWSRLARTNHAVTVHNNLAWHMEPVNNIVATNINTGEVEKRINFDDVIYVNRDIGGLEIRRDIVGNQDISDAFHLNDVDPLSAEFIDDFPQFSEGDLLISLGFLDMIAVLDPDTLKIKWWRVGITKRQHDPDWQHGGVITIFDNQMTEYEINGISRIVSVNPETYVTNTIYSGLKHDAYSWRRGKHQILSDGSILMTLPEQGRVILVNVDGSLRFDFHNKFDDKYNLLVSEAIYLPADYFDTDLSHNKCK